MKLLSIGLARSIWLFPVNDLNPRGRSLYPMLFAALVKKYEFQKFPKTADELNEQSGIKFERGVFWKTPAEPIAVSLTIYHDGIVADTRSSTTDSDAFLAEALAEASKEFKLEPIQNISVRKTYVGEVHVQTQHSLNLLNDKLGPFLHRLSTIPGFGEQHFETTGISFGVDQWQQTKPVSFRLERAINVPFSENRYYSIAPLPTDAHLRLLDDLETILRGDPYT